MVCTKGLITHNAEMLRNLSTKEKDTLQEMTIITSDKLTDGMEHSSFITDISHLIGKGYLDCYSGM